MATLAEAAGIEEVDQCNEKEPYKEDRCSEGTSFVPLAKQLASVANNNVEDAATWKNASFSQYPRANGNGFTIMGYSMTTSSSLRFTAWVDFDLDTNTTQWTMDQSKCAFELYNHTSDPNENANIADDEGNEELVDELFQKLKLGWRATASKI